ncbi:hypothetical protein ACQJBY_023060 [Aegilops geniculata]
MHSDPPSPAAERRLSTRKRAAAREGDGDGDAVFYVDRDSEPRIPLRFKRPRIQMEGEGESERRLSTHTRAAAAAADLHRESRSPTFRVCLPDSHPLSSVAEATLATRKRAAATEAEAEADVDADPDPDPDVDVDLDLGSRTYREVVVRPYSAADFETGPKRSEVNPGSRGGPDCTSRKRAEESPQAKSPRHSKGKDRNRKHKLCCLDDGGMECCRVDDDSEERRAGLHFASGKRIEEPPQEKSTRQSKEHDNNKKHKLYCLDDDGMECHNADNDSKESCAGLHGASRKRIGEPPQEKSTMQSKEHDNNKKRKLYCSDDDGMELHNADNDSEEQLFVKVHSSHVSLQANMKQTSVNTLVQSAFVKAGINTNDFYCIYAGKCLHNEDLLSCYSLQRDSVIMVRHRLRAGMLQTFNYPDWDNVIHGVNCFRRIQLPYQLCDTKRNITSALFLSEQIQGYASEAVAALCKIFLGNDTLNGNFNSSDILFRDGHFIFADTVQRHQFTAVGGRLDLRRLHAIFQPVFQTGNPQDIVLYVNHLLHFLNACPVGVDLQSEAVVAFLCNHFALQDYSQKIATCHMLRAMIERLVGPAAVRFMNYIAGVPNFGPAWTVQTLKTVYTYKAVVHPVTGRIIRVRYSRNGAAFVRLGSNFFKHARTNANFSMELLEAAFSATMSQGDFLVNLLQRIAVLQQPLPYPGFDAVKMLGKKVRT